MNLRNRLHAIADMIDSCKTVADIGTDHGKLPVYLLLNKIAQHAIACDISMASLRKAIELAKKMGTYAMMEFRCGDGLSVIRPGESDVIVIAGIGGDLTMQILGKGEGIADSSILVIQPMKDEDAVRRYLYLNNYMIIDEDLAMERDKIYTIIKAMKGNWYGNVPEIDDIFFDIGPVLYDKKHPLLREYIRRKVGVLQDIAHQSCDSVILERIKGLEGILHELDMSRCD